MWNLPGGKVETHESPWDAVLREVEEEVGLRARVVRLLGVYTVPERADVVFNFLCAPIGGELGPSEEADGIGWFEPHNIPVNTLRRHIERIEDAFAPGEAVSLKVQV